jgi:TolB-like protein/Tfp pilus assembly protein PilF
MKMGGPDSSSSRDSPKRVVPPREIAPDDVRAQLQRILASPEFDNSPRLQAFLQFVVEESLAGRAKRIKAFSIGHAVFSSNEDFDPQTNSIVRVEAGRLRRRLAEYYQTQGGDDAVIIGIPKGAYEPKFSWNSMCLPGPEASSADSRLFRGSSRRISLTAGLTLLILLVIVGGFFVKNYRPQSTEWNPGFTSGPFVAVLPMSAVSDDPLEKRLAVGLVEAIITKLSKLSGLSVMAHASIVQVDSSSMSIDMMTSEYGATHVLRGSLEREGGKLRTNVQLIDASTAATIWADQLEGSVEKLLDLQDEIAEQVAEALSIRVDPTERDRFLYRHSNDAEALLLFRQALVLVMPPNDVTRVLAARQLFRRVIQIDPTYAGGYAGESFTHSFDVAFLRTTNRVKSLREAIASATKATDVDPNFGMGYATLAFAYALSGKVGESLANAEQAIVAQPGDAFCHWMLGVSLILAGEPDKATGPLERAIQLDPVKPRTPYLNVLGIAHYAAGDYETAVSILERNIRRGGPTGPHMDVFLIASFAQLRWEQKAQEAANKILLSHPNFPVERWLTQFLGTGERLSSTMANLDRLGIPLHE